jgi:hypothetical protein
MVFLFASLYASSHVNPLPFGAKFWQLMAGGWADGRHDWQEWLDV